MAPANHVRFYYDFISPYAYLGWVGLRRFVASSENPPTVEPIPVLFAGLLDHWGQKGPAEIPAKRTFTFQDVFRRGAKAGLTLDLPVAHPFNPLLPLRLMVALKDEPKRGKVISKIYEACWQERRDITRPETLLEILTVTAIPQPKEKLAACQEDAVKEALRQNTEDAVAAGVFGVPSYQINGTILWGSDQVEFLGQCLAGEDPALVLGDELDSLPAAAQRK